MFRNPRKVFAVKYVETATIVVKSPLVKVDAGSVNERPIFCTASTTKMKDISVEKISSVNRVRYLTKLDADVTELCMYDCRLAYSYEMCVEKSIKAEI